MSLSDTKCRNAKPGDKPYRLPDGNGLYLDVRTSGLKIWRYRFLGSSGKESTFTVGNYPAVSLQDARRARDEARDVVREGRSPVVAQRADKLVRVAASNNTFEGIAREWIEKKRAGWSPYYTKQVISALETNVFPDAGRFPIADVSPAVLLAILQKMEKRGVSAYAIFTRGLCSSIFRYAVQTLRAESDPAALLKGSIIRAPINHAQPMDGEQISLFVSRLHKFKGNRTTALALGLLLLTFVRTVEMRKAEWTEVDLDAELWTVPASKMKMKRIHLVPLSIPVVAMLRELQSITGAGRYLFPNTRRPSDMMSATTVNRALEHMGYASGSLTGHDFRATASTRLHELGYRSDLIEMQLAHADKDKVRGAYNHAEYLAERRGMLQAWADWVLALPAPDVIKA